MKLWILAVAVCACSHGGPVAAPAAPSAPSLLAAIPADTPYVVAALEPLPLDYLAKMKRAIGPAFEKGFAKALEHPGNAEGDRLLRAMLAELDGKWNAAGFDALGIGATPRFAVYGLGLLPVVFRLELRDPSALRQAIDRVARNAGVTVPPPRTLGDRSYWRFGDHDLEIVIAINAGELVLGVGPPDRLTATLPLILGTERPPAAMADGGALVAAMKRHGFRPNLVGIADVRALGHALAARAPAACGAEIDRVAERMPRIVFGHTQLDATRASGGFVVELAPDLIKELDALHSVAPRLDTTGAMLAMQVALDLSKLPALGRAAADRIRALGNACGLPELASNETLSLLTSELPAPFSQLEEVGVVLTSITTGAGGPKAIDGVIHASSPVIHDVFDALDAKLGIARLGLAADGALHTLQVPMVPFGIVGGVGPRVMALGAGPTGTELARQLLTATSAERAPLLSMSYDYARFAELQQALGQTTDPVTAAVAQVFAGGALEVDVDAQGLGFWGTIDLR